MVMNGAQAKYDLHCLAKPVIAFHQHGSPPCPFSKPHACPLHLNPSLCHSVCHDRELSMGCVFIFTTMAVLFGTLCG